MPMSPNNVTSNPTRVPAFTTARRTLVGVALSWMSWSGCDPGPDDCCNGCGRNYSVGAGRVRLWISNIQEGGNECEIDDLPTEIPEGINTLVVVAEELAEGHTAPSGVEVEDHFADDATAQACDGLEVYTAEEFVAAAVAPGTRACIVDEVIGNVACSQKECAGGLSCSVRSR